MLSVSLVISNICERAILIRAGGHWMVYPSLEQLHACVHCARTIPRRIYLSVINIHRPRRNVALNFPPAPGHFMQSRCKNILRRRAARLTTFFSVLEPLRIILQLRPTNKTPILASANART